MMTTTEAERRSKLKSEKPGVYAKVARYAEKIALGESIAMLQLQYSYRCNMACQHCCVTNLRNPNAARPLALADVREIARQADAMGLAQFVVTGGEPLAFPDFRELVAAINPANFHITWDSNGWFLDYERARELKTIGVDKIQLSLDSLEAAEHDAFRRMPGSHARAVRAIDASHSAGLAIIIQTVVTKQRVRSQEFIAFLEWAKTRGVGVFVSFAKPVGAWRDNYDVLVDAGDLEYVRQLRRQYDVFTHLTPAYGLDIGCIAVKRMVSITVYGDVMPCPYMHVSLGNVLREPLKEIIARGMRLKQFRDKADTCWMALDAPFIERLARASEGRSLPINWDAIYGDDDFVKGE